MTGLEIILLERELVFPMKSFSHDMLMACEIFSVCVGLAEDHMIYFTTVYELPSVCQARCWDGKVKIEPLSLGGCVER